MLRRINCALMTTGLAFLAQVAYAQASVSADPLASHCRVLVSPAPPSWEISGFDPFGDTAAEGTFSVSFTNQSDVECEFTANFELTQPPFGLSKGSASRLNYAILDLNESQDVTPRAGRSQRRSNLRPFTLGPRETRSVLYRLVIDPSPIRSAGTFSQELILEAQDAEFRSFGGAPISIGFRVLPSARIGLTGAYTMNNGQAFVDLGQLRPGPAPVPLNLRVNSTGQYEITVSSANSGVLRLEASEWSIPYEMIIGEETLNLRGMQRIGRSDSDKVMLDVLPMRFIIGSTKDLRAGRYSDVISISVSAR